MRCCEKRARLLLERGRAVVDPRYPFTRCALYEASADTGLPVEASCGGRTKFNRSQLGIPKPHALDAAYLGEVGGRVGRQQPTLAIKASGRGDDLTKLTAHGLPRVSCMCTKSVGGRVGHADAINARDCKLLHCADGCCYAQQPALPPRREERGFRRGRP